MTPTPLSATGSTHSLTAAPFTEMAVKTGNRKSSFLIPKLEDYGIDERTGFLGRPPIRRLPDPYFEPWEKVLDDVSHLLVAWKLRAVVRKVNSLFL
jgi:hypothetical protein